jgi:aryl-alcohol dehydrogenase-like predicted oxidoreductase
MRTRQLGNSELYITPVGIGTRAIGATRHKFGAGLNDDDSIAAIRKALEYGINWIDTAPVHGLGYSEEIVARALDGISLRPYVFTKCGRIWSDNGEIVYGSLKANSIRKECEDSLRRLNVDRIDLYQIHCPDPDRDIEEGWATLAALQQEGKVHYIGLSGFNVIQMQRATSIAQITSVQSPYSLLERGIEQDVLPYCALHNIGVIVSSPIKSGLLTGAMTPERIRALPQDDRRRSDPDFRGLRLHKNLDLVERLRTVGERCGLTPAEAAIDWALRDPQITGAIVAVRRPEHVAGIIGGADFCLGPPELAEIEAYFRLEVEWAAHHEQLPLASQ